MNIPLVLKTGRVLSCTPSSCAVPGRPLPGQSAVAVRAAGTSCSCGSGAIWVPCPGRSDDMNLPPGSGLCRFYFLKVGGPWTQGLSRKRRREDRPPREVLGGDIVGPDCLLMCLSTTSTHPAGPCVLLQSEASGFFTWEVSWPFLKRWPPRQELFILFFQIHST